MELTDTIATLSRSSIPAGIDLLGGSNLDEGTEFMSLCPPLSCNATAAELAAWTVEQFGAELGPLVCPLFWVFLCASP